jgi:hypothetical protein
MIPRRDFASRMTYLALVLLSLAAASIAFTPSPLFGTPTVASSSPSLLTRFAVKSKNPSGYTPKWVKKTTLADERGSTKDIGFDKVGLKGTIPVVFKQGNATRTSMAWAGQPIRDVATQAGQYIKYGCGEGECGTCECMVDGKWIRPCVATVPATVAGQEMIVQIKAFSAVKVSSGKFFSLRSFLMGLWNNILGMIGFVTTRRAARKNWEERKTYEDMVLEKTLEKKRSKRAEEGGSA